MVKYLFPEDLKNLLVKLAGLTALFLGRGSLTIVLISFMVSVLLRFSSFVGKMQFWQFILS